MHNSGKQRDITVCAQLHCKICKEMGVKLDSELWYDHVLKSVETGHEGKVTILWNQQVQTDRTIRNNKPDIIIRNDKKGTCMLIDSAIPGERNVIKGTEKILKYEDLIIEIQLMWNVKTKVISVIRGATGTISKSFRKYLSNVPGMRDVPEPTKQPHLALHTYCGKYCCTVQRVYSGK